MIAAIKNDMIRVISKYMKIEKTQCVLPWMQAVFRWSDPSPACTPCGYTDTVHVQQGAILICFLITTLEIITFVLWPI